MKPAESLEKRVVNAFMLTGRARHSKNTVAIQYIVDFCELNKIPYILEARPGSGYFIQKDNEEKDPFNYKSKGDKEVTEAVKFMLEESYPARHYGGPHKWNNQLLRYVGRLMANYAKYVKENECHNQTSKETSVR